MNFSINFTHHFENKFKRYRKKFPSLDTDLKTFVKDLPETKGKALGEGFYKYRLAVKSKTQGKRSGFRIITFEVLVVFNEKIVTLITLYDKSEQASITKKEILSILKRGDLL
jgi:hypothetical protein